MNGLPVKAAIGVGGKFDLVIYPFLVKSMNHHSSAFDFQLTGWMKIIIIIADRFNFLD